jgi:hypothetical protein
MENIYLTYAVTAVSLCSALGLGVLFYFFLSQSMASYGGEILGE